jgi:hypothetical protein
MGGNGSAPKPATARPAPTKKLGWDPHDINDPMAGYSLDQIRQIVRYHWDESENSFWRDKCSNREFFERNLPKMAKQIPVSWLHPKKVGKKSFMHPTPRPEG